MSDPMTETRCPACGANAGEKCQTMIEGIDMGWTHDARFMAPVLADLAAARLCDSTPGARERAEQANAEIETEESK